MLIVDDDRDVGHLYSGFLARGGIDAVVVTDGPAALDYLRLHDVGLVLLDRGMPGMDGIEVLEALRRDSHTRDLPVIVLTGANGTAELVRILDAGADACLTRPIDAAELVAQIRAVLRGRAGETELRRVIHRANDAYVSWDEAGSITGWNTRATEIFGHTRSEVLGQPLVTMIFSPSHRERHALQMRRFRDSGGSPAAGQWVELVCLQRNGAEIPVEMTIWTVGSDGTNSFHALVRDLSPRRELERALDRDSRMRELVDGGPDMVTMGDESGLFYVSPACRTMLGFEPGELLGLFPVTHPDDREATLLAYRQTLSTGVPFSTSCRVRTKSGGYVWLESHGCAVGRDGDPSGVAVHAVWRDVSARVRMAQGRALAASVLEAANATLAETLEREHRALGDLQELSRAKADFVSTVSHELRTPLTNIMGYSEILGDLTSPELDADQAHAVQAIERNPQRLLVMIDDLLLVGHAEAGDLDVAMAPVTLGPIVDAASAVARRAALAHDVEVQVKIWMVPEVLADAAQINRVVLNLLSNAIKFTPPGGHVEINATVESSHVAVTVRDDGIGIALEDQERIFERFFRGSVATERAIQGSGLGLFVVKHIVEMHGGRVSVRSLPERGTEFTFTLPIARDAVIR